MIISKQGLVDFSVHTYIPHSLRIDRDAFLGSCEVLGEDASEYRDPINHTRSSRVYISSVRLITRWQSFTEARFGLMF